MMAGAPPSRLLAPGKINLALHVAGRQADGYHQLESIFLPLELQDELELSLAPGPPGVCCRCPGHPELEGPHNLAARAARAFLQRTGHRVQADIVLRKRVWTAAGLGGGSSDGAAVLLGMQRRLGGLTSAELAAVALELGSDVPFFLLGRPALARGRGELLTPLDGVPSLPLLLCNPGLPLSTREVFQRLRLRGRAALPDRQRLLPPEFPRTLEGLALLAHNDLWPPALELLPLLGSLRDKLARLGPLAVGLSGSGPTLFGVFPALDAARRAAAVLAGEPSVLLSVTRTIGSGP